MMIQHLTHMVIHALAGMIPMKVQDHMAAVVAIMMMILMLLHNVVLVVVDQMVAEMLLVRLMTNH